MTIQNRVQPDVPSGGQFASHDRPDFDLDLPPGAEGPLRPFTVFGHWSDDELTLTYAFEGSHSDHRDEYIDGKQSFCSDVMATSADDAKAKVVEEYVGGGSPSGLAATPADDISTPDDGAPKTYTVFGRWVEDELFIDAVLEGWHADDRDDLVDGEQSFCSSAEATSPEEARELVLRETFGD